MKNIIENSSEFEIHHEEVIDLGVASIETKGGGKDAISDRDRSGWNTGIEA